MATFVLLHGAASDGWYWHLVEPRLQAAGHRTIAPDLPCDDDAAGFAEYADVVVAAIEGADAGADELVLVAQSMAGFTAPIVATRVPVTTTSSMSEPAGGAVPASCACASGATVAPNAAATAARNS